MGEKESSWGLLTHIRMIGLGPALESLRYVLRRRWKNMRFAGLAIPQPDPAQPWQRLGAVGAYAQDARGVTFTSAAGTLRIDVLAEDCFRVRVLPTGELSEPFSYAVVKSDWAPVSFSVEETDDAIRLTVGERVYRVDRATTHLTLTTGNGQVVYQDADGPAWRGEHVRLSARLTPDESGHGLGERAFAFNLRGRSYSLWNTDPAGYARGDDPINLSIPLYVGLRGPQAYGLFWDNSARGRVSVGAPDSPDSLVFEGETGELRYYLFTGPSLLDVLERYTALTGRMPLPPLWALGYHQCRWSYMSAEEAREVARQFRQRHIPCDAIYLDIDYMDGFRCFTWNRETFPDPAGLIQDLKADGFRTVVMIDPGIKADRAYHVCQSGLEHDAFLKYPDGSHFIAPVWPGDCYFPDFTSPAAREWWGRLYAGLLEAGVAGVWNDMNEPAIFSSTPAFKDMPDYLPHAMEGQGGNHLLAHNIYGMQMVRASRAGLEALQPERRHLLITRAGFAGVQRYASSWTADNLSTWDHLRLSISMCLNLGVSGLPFTGPDIGGFAYDGNGELLTRWMQAALLLPFFRGHSAKGTARQEPWAFGQPYEDINRETIELRYRLLPYIYTTFAACAAEGWPIIRPLAMLEDGFADCDDQYLHGDSLMLAPVVEQGAVSRTVRFPAGDWYDFRTGGRQAGGETVSVEAPLHTVPLYARAGCVIPEWPVSQFVGDGNSEWLILRVFAGEGESRLYEDAGDGQAYLEGKYRWSDFRMTHAAGKLALEWAKSGAFTPPYDRVSVCVADLDAAPSRILADGQPVEWRTEAGWILVDCAPFDRLEVLTGV